MPLTPHGDEVVFPRRLYDLLRRYRGKSTNVEKVDWMPLCRFELPHGKFHLMRDVVDRRRDLDFERRQRVNLRV